MLPSIALLLALSLQSAAQAQAAAQTPASPPCSRPEYRQFDFWVGQWEVTTPDGQPAGRNEIRRVHGSCVLLENWTGARGMTGSSLNIFVASEDRWHQTWADSSGGLLVLTGRVRPDGSMHMTGTGYSATAGQSLDRVTWTPTSGGGVRQFWERSTDGGKTWTVVFDGRYSRVSP